MARAGLKDDPVTAYARAVANGQLLTNRLVRLACARHHDNFEKMLQEKKLLMS